MNDLSQGLEEFTVTHQLISSCVIGPYQFFSGVPLAWQGDPNDMVWWVARDGKWLSRESYTLKQAFLAAAHSERKSKD
mgnify:FL=1